MAATACVACKKATPAPLYGSTPKLSTLAGFVEGTWKMGTDSTGARSKNVAGMIDVLGALSPGMTINADGTYIYSFGFYLARGKWSCDTTGVNLVLLTVDGRPKDQVQREYDAWRSYVHGWDNVDYRARLHRDWENRGMTLTMAKGCTRLELYGDNRRLYMPGPYIHEDGSTFAGIQVWERK